MRNPRTLVDIARSITPYSEVREIVEVIQRKADFQQTIIDLGWGDYTEDGCHFIYWGPTGTDHVFPNVRSK